MTDDERIAFLNRKPEPNYRNLVQAAKWDFDKGQLAFTKRTLVIEYCKKYIKELKAKEQTPHIINCIASTELFKKQLKGE